MLIERNFPPLSPISPITQKDNSDGVPFSSNPYKSLLKCSCGKVFRSFEQLEHHTWHKHAWKRPSYSIVNIDGSYIANRVKNCSTSVGIFNHDKLWDKPSNLVCEKKKKILITCGLKCCNKKNCEHKRFLRVFDRVYSKVKNFKNPKLLTLNKRTHTNEFNIDFKKKLEEQFDYFINKLLRKSLRENPMFFIDPTKVRNLRQVIQLYQNYPISWYRVLELKETKGLFWHYHVIIDMPFIPAQKLTEFWHKATKDSPMGVDIESIRELTEEELGKIKSSKLWEIVSKKYPSVKEKLLLSVWYITKYIIKSRVFIKTQDNYEFYAKFVYGKHFIACSIIKLSSTCQSENENSAKRLNFLLCSCGYPLKFSHTEFIEVDVVDKGGEYLYGK